MANGVNNGHGKHILEHGGLQDLIDTLRGKGYTVIAPVLREGVVRLGPVKGIEDISHGIHDEQGPGTYKVVEEEGALMFDYAAALDSAKPFLFPPVQRLYQLHVEGERFVLDEGPPMTQKLAFLGLRPCDVAGMKVLDRVFGIDDSRKMRCEEENYYEQTRRDGLVIVVNCNRPGGTCFCVSMGTGPEALEGFDLALTELRTGFLVSVGSERGEQIVKELPVRSPTASEIELAELKMARARDRMGRKLDMQGVREVLERSIEHPHWDEVAKRCLSCGSCTMVCPACFCSTVSDSTVLDEETVERDRLWASCFSHQFSYTTAGPVRNSIRGRYRHWLRHKLCTFFDQFGCSGCVGCGRCITWCPVGIDITQEATTIQNSEAGSRKEAQG
ncbi:MAG TPA: 4Fe-4S dicluster domain-containing protein [Phycisphaerae bacterium]|nr:4Fe-4S dicluster domain-containing protein [Phycisphaerae bacterium]